MESTVPTASPSPRQIIPRATESPRETIPSNAPTSSPPAPSHAAAPAGEASEIDKGPQERLRRPSGNRVRSARPCPSASSGRIKRSQGTISARTSATKKPIAAPRWRAPDGVDHPYTSHSPPTDHSGAATASPTRKWAPAAAQRQHPPTPTPNLTVDRDSNRTEGPGANTAFPTAALPTFPMENPEDTPPPTPPTENTRDVKHQS